MNTNNSKRAIAGERKAEWVQPELRRLSAGAAESGESGNLDNSGAQRS
jgi:hypothetical protein